MGFLEGQLVVQGLRHGDRLGRFALGHREVDRLEGPRFAGQPGLQRFQVPGGHLVVRHHECLLGSAGQRQVDRGLSQQARPHHDVVGGTAHGHGDPDHRRTSAIRAATSAGRPAPSTRWWATSRYAAFRSRSIRRRSTGPVNVVFAGLLQST